jgi:hypothetical protein
MSPTATNWPVDRLPPPPLIHQYQDWLYRELALVRCLLRVSQATRQGRVPEPADRKEASHAS